VVVVVPSYVMCGNGWNSGDALHAVCDAGDAVGKAVRLLGATMPIIIARTGAAVYGDRPRVGARVSRDSGNRDGAPRPEW
jgi:hypothetical protein